MDDRYEDDFDGPSSSPGGLGALIGRSAKPKPAPAPVVAPVPGPVAEAAVPASEVVAVPEAVNTSAADVATKPTSAGADAAAPAQAAARPWGQQPAQAAAQAAKPVEAPAVAEPARPAPQAREAVAAPATAPLAKPATAPADPFEVAAPPADPFQAAAPKPAILPGGTILETERDRRANFLEMLTRPDANTVTRGDGPLPEAGVQPASQPGGPQETREQKLARIGFPGRPRVWPIMMRWPSDRDLDLIADPAVTAEQRQAYLRGLQKRQAEMQKRAEDIDAYLRKHDGQPKGMWKGRRFEAVAQVDPFYGIRFATLLSEQDTAGVSRMVATWGHEVAETIDGGRVRATKDAITVESIRRGPGPRPPIPESAVQLAIREGIARGWNSFNVSGTKEFAMMFAQQARNANVAATITYRTGAFWQVKKTIRVMPAPPGMAPAPQDPAKDGIDPDVGLEAGADAGAAGKPKAASRQDDTAKKYGNDRLFDDDPSVSAFGS